MKKITELPAWQGLQNHKKHISKQRMQDWFLQDPQRFQRFSLAHENILLDYSKNLINDETLKLLFALAEQVNLPAKIESLFRGDCVNVSEQKPALHTALRNRHATSLIVDNENIFEKINACWQQMQNFVNAVQQGQFKGVTGKKIQDIVNIGIGGSHHGPLLTIEALHNFARHDLHCHFISNVDSAHLNDVLHKINPETTLFIISSKSFSTLETLTNAATIKAWVQTQLPHFETEKQFIAVTAEREKALAFGIPFENIFPLWDWVGGRYSIWSAIGLPLALMVGMENFFEFLAGAHAMDEHFRHAAFHENMPVILALLGLWYINFFDTNNHAIVPYSHRLTYLKHYLQQADMESNGKSISQQHDDVEYATGPIIWGEQGCNAQHSFHQLLHQGKHFIPVDFVLAGAEQLEFSHHHDVLIASALSQAQALMKGKTFAENFAELIEQGFSEIDAQTLAKHKTILGNRPSNILFLKKISPYNLGALLALYEHKIFVQGALWNINSFDQWGVELGKTLLPPILNDLKNNNTKPGHDSSTEGLIDFYKSLRVQA